MATSNIQLLEKFIDFCSIKNKVISKNISNIGTENYRKETVSFKSLFDTNLESTLKKSSEKHLQIPPDLQKAHIEIARDDQNESGVNNVDIETEMAALAENSLQFKFAARKISSYYKNLQKVIKGGGN